jgi:hypothetical protein
MGRERSHRDVSDDEPDRSRGFLASHSLLGLGPYGSRRSQSHFCRRGLRVGETDDKQ